VPVDLGLGGAGLLRDLPHAQIGSEPVDRPEGRLDDLAADLFAVFAPPLAARVDLLLTVVGRLGLTRSAHVKHHTAWPWLTWGDRAVTWSVSIDRRFPRRLEAHI